MNIELNPSFGVGVVILLVGLAGFGFFAILLLVRFLKRGQASAGGVHWVALAGLLMLSCLTSTCGVLGLYLNLSQPNAVTVAAPGLDQTRAALAQTEAVMAQQLTSNAQKLNATAAETLPPPSAATPIPPPTQTEAQALVLPPTETQRPADPGPQLTGNQRIDEHSITDDFSSNALGWPVYDDGVTILKYENEAYSFQIKDKGYYDWVYFPVEFSPAEISFDVQGPAGDQEGTFGVFCQYQDENNYYYVEFDLGLGEYTIAQNRNGEHIPLVAQNAQGQYWQPASLLKPAPSTNRIGIGCYLGTIYLIVNDEVAGEASIAEPFTQKGRSAFFVYAFEFAGDEGYQVFIDNVEAYEPVQ